MFLSTSLTPSTVCPEPTPLRAGPAAVTLPRRHGAVRADGNPPPDRERSVHGAKPTHSLTPALVDAGASETATARTACTAHAHDNAMGEAAVLLLAVDTAATGRPGMIELATCHPVQGRRHGL